MDKATMFPWEFDGETVTFETPEQTRVEFRVAPFGTRIVAAILDQVIIVLVSLAFGFLAFLGAYMGSALGEESSLILFALILIFQFLFSLFYYVWGELRGDSQTWGKRRMKIRVILISGQGLTLGASVIRNLARVIDQFPILWLVPVLAPGRRRLGDFLAGTLVVLAGDPGARQKRPTDWLDGSYRELEDRQFYFSSEQAGKLYPDDLNLLEHLGGRLASMRKNRSRKALEDVARRYVIRLGLEEDEERVLQDPARFLQELGLFLRDRFEGQAY